MVKTNINEQGGGVKKWEFWTNVLFECSILNAFYSIFMNIDIDMFIR